MNFGNTTPVTGSATFYVTATGNLTGNIPAGMTVRVAGTNSFVSLDAANDVTNNGMLQLANDNSATGFSAFFSMASASATAAVPEQAAIVIVLTASLVGLNCRLPAVGPV